MILVYSKSLQKIVEDLIKVEEQFDILISFYMALNYVVWSVLSKLE